MVNNYLLNEYIRKGGRKKDNGGVYGKRRIKDAKWENCVDRTIKKHRWIDGCMRDQLKA